MRYLFFLFIFIASMPGAVLGQDSIACYYNKYQDECKKEQALYFRVGKKDRKDRWQGYVRDYYISGKIFVYSNYVDDVMEGSVKTFYENGNLRSSGKYLSDSKQGEWFFYHENGNLKEQGTIENGWSAGEWKEYYKNGQLKSKGIYDHGFKINTWSTYYQNGQLKDEISYTRDEKMRSKPTYISAYDSTGKVMIQKGNGEFNQWNEGGKYIEMGAYKNGLKDGVWQTTGQRTKSGYREEYSEGKFISGQSWDTTGQQYSYTVLNVEPEFIDGMTGLQKYLVNTIRYPRYAEKRSIMGKVYIEFVVNASGEVTDAVVMRGVHDVLNGEALRVVEKMPDWKPGLMRGQPSRTKYILPINFKIN